jgi:dTDP-4-amino-4,6-dideoxygalactose transaminase
MKVPLLDINAQYLDIMDEIRIEIDKVLTSHQYILGPAVREFEEAMQSYHGVKHAIGCASGTDALQLALMALGIGPGDEVITTPFTFFATASTIHRVGAKPVFVDICEDTFNIDTVKIADAITDKTKAILPVHIFGQAANMDSIMLYAHKYGLKVIEDNAQGVGAKYKSEVKMSKSPDSRWVADIEEPRPVTKTLGTIGDIGTLSFFPSKNLGGMGDGGMCLTNCDDLASKLKQLRVHGENPKYYHKWVGLNSRLDSLQAAVLKVKLKYLDGWSEGRRRNAAIYQELLGDMKKIKLPAIDPNAVSIYNQYTITCRLHRDELMAYLQENGIGCAIYYPLSLHLQECFAYLGGKLGDLPVSEKVSNSVLSLPIYAELTRPQIEYVCKKIREFYKG